LQQARKPATHKRLHDRERIADLTIIAKPPFAARQKNGADQAIKPDRRRRNDFIPRVRQLNQRNTALVSTMDHSV
jgi:hypothetical protein